MEERLRRVNISMCNMMEEFYKDLQEATEMQSESDRMCIETEKFLCEERNLRSALQDDLELRDKQLQSQTVQLNDVHRQLEKERAYYREKIELLEKEVNGMATDNFRLEAAKAQHDKLLDTLLDNGLKGLDHQQKTISRLRFFKKNRRFKFAAQKYEEPPRNEIHETVNRAKPNAIPSNGPDVISKCKDRADTCVSCMKLEAELRTTQQRLRDTVLQLQRVQDELDASTEALHILRQNISRPVNAKVATHNVDTSLLNDQRSQEYSLQKGESSLSCDIIPLENLFSRCTHLQDDQHAGDSEHESVIEQKPCTGTPLANRKMVVTNLDATEALAVTSSQVVTPQLPRNRYEQIAKALAKQHLNMSGMTFNLDDDKKADSKDAADQNENKNLSALLQVQQLLKQREDIKATSVRSGSSSLLSTSRRALTPLNMNSTNQNCIKASHVSNQSSYSRGGKNSFNTEMPAIGDHNSKCIKVMLLSEGLREWIPAVIELRENMLAIKSISSSSFRQSKTGQVQLSSMSLCNENISSHYPGQNVITFFDLRRSPETFVISTHLSRDLSVLSDGGNINEEECAFYLAHHPPCWIGQEVLIQTNCTDSRNRLAKSLKATISRFLSPVADDTRCLPKKVCRIPKSTHPIVLHAEESGAVKIPSNGEKLKSGAKARISSSIIIKVLTLIDGSHLAVSEQGLFWIKKQSIEMNENIHIDSSPAFSMAALIHDAVLVSELGIIVIVVGSQRCMKFLPLSALQRSCCHESTSKAPTSNKDESPSRSNVSHSTRRESRQTKPSLLCEIPSSDDTLVFDVGTVSPNSTFLFSAHKDCMALYCWSAETRAFVLLRQAKGSRYTDPTTCLKFIPSMKKFVWGATRFSSLEPIELDIEDLLDVEDPNLALHFTNEELGNICPMDVFEFGTDRILLCFNQYGLVVDHAGRIVVSEPNKTWHVNTPLYFELISEDQVLCIIGHTSIELQDSTSGKSQIVALPHAKLFGLMNSAIYLYQDREAFIDIFKLETPHINSKAAIVSTFSSLIYVDKDVSSTENINVAVHNESNKDISQRRGSFLPNELTFQARQEIAALDDVLGAFDL